MIEICFHHDPDRLPHESQGLIPVLMYGRRPPRDGSCSIGGPVHAAIRRLGVPVDSKAFDFLTIAMAVTAADTFVNREHCAADGWSREFRLRIPLFDPAPWMPILPLLEKALHFLSGDQWSIELLPDGLGTPVPQRRGRLTQLAGHDCVSLFSGGLDSAIGVLDLIADGKRPVLVSHSYRGDAKHQRIVNSLLPVECSRFCAVANPLSRLESLNDVQMRTRSFNFMAYGTLVAATMASHHVVHSPVDLFVPENGLIALNPPLTPRRIGSLSTRTTHPYFISFVQQMLHAVNIPVSISNMYAKKTKGEMIAQCSDSASLSRVAKNTVSCGKWKRDHKQCGCCVPCLIRRAAFHSVGMQDDTDYSDKGRVLSRVLRNEIARDDLLAMMLATRRLHSTDVRQWVAQAGPLPYERAERDDLVDVVRRGMVEVSNYLQAQDVL